MSRYLFDLDRHDNINNSSGVDMALKWPLARTTDPDTSFDAGDSMAGSIPNQHKEILAVLADKVPRAAEQISDELGHDIWRRMSELEKLGLVEKCINEPKHKNRTNRQAYKYRAL